MTQTVSIASYLNLARGYLALLGDTNKDPVDHTFYVAVCDDLSTILQIVRAAEDRAKELWDTEMLYELRVLRGRIEAAITFMENKWAANQEK